jgi:hypothetical protein
MKRCLYLCNSMSPFSRKKCMVANANITKEDANIAQTAGDEEPSETGGQEVGCPTPTPSHSDASLSANKGPAAQSSVPGAVLVLPPLTGMETTASTTRKRTSTPRTLSPQPRCARDPQDAAARRTGVTPWGYDNRARGGGTQALRCHSGSSPPLRYSRGVAPLDP